MPASIERVTARDGTTLMARRWAPAGDHWATVLLVHGLAEHSGRYEHVGEQLAAAGLDVHAMDLRGFGASGGRRAWVDRWSQFHDDLEERIAAIRASSPAPVVLYGHSMGGLVCLGYVLDGRASPDLLVLSAPAIDASIPAWKRALARVLGRIAPRTMVSNDLDDEDLSSDPAVGAAYRADPLNIHRSTVGFGLRAFAEQQRVRRDLDRLSIPTLVVHGAEDRIVPAHVSRPLDDRPSVTRRVYPDVRHELHNEPLLGGGVIAEIVDWIRDQISRRGQGGRIGGN
jgi:acylglycerol lipase